MPKLRAPLALASSSRLAALALALAAAGCTTPDLSEYEPRTGIITGTIFYPNGTARGNVVVVLFRADAPPPPQGTGTPVNLVVVPKKELFHDIPEGVPGEFAAPFTMPTVPKGTYQIRAFLDADGNFNPSHDLLAQPSAGDVGGGHIDLATQAFLPIQVENDRVTPQVTVTLGLTYPVERPAFELAGTTSLAVPLAAPTAITLKSHPITRAPLAMRPEKTAFLVQYVDLDGDGRPDDANGDHLPDVYPRVVLRKLGQAAGAPAIIVPGIIDPLPYQDALASAGAALATELQVILPPVAVERSATGDRILPAIPAGSYETILISGTGQTWTVPNALDTDLPATPAAPDPTQAVVFQMTEGPALPAGRIEGTVRVASDSRADTYVIAFDVDDPPPPLGTGRPVALATVTAATYLPVEGAPTTLEAPFVLSGLPDGNYLVRGFADVDRSFSPLVELLAQPSAADVGGGSTPAVVQVSQGTPASGVRVDLLDAVAFDRPVFALTAPELARTGFPAAIELDAHPLALFGSTERTSLLPVALGSGDQDGDNLRDLLPRVLLTRMTDGGADPRATPDDPESIVIPGIVDPLPFITALAGGVPAVPASALRVILPPVAVKLGAGGARELLSPPPAGRYRVNLLSPTGQTWSVPSTLDLALGRVGTPREDPTQAAYVTVADTPVPGGAIAGMVTLLGAPPEGDYQVVVLAFASSAPPPPAGSGRPVASAIVRKAAFGSGGTAAYALSGLPTGTYQVRAFLDANDDFVPWFDTRNQPDAGDVGGGHVLLPAGVLQDVAVDALGAPVTGVDVSILPPVTYPTDRPSFTFDQPAEPSFDPATGPYSVRLAALVEESDVLRQRGTFPVSWRDLDHDGLADDFNADGVPEVFPIIVAELLDPADPTNLTASPEHIIIPGIVSPLQFQGTAFPLGDPTDVVTTIATSTITVVFPPVAIDAAGSRLTPPAGRYRVTVVNGHGQTWSLPNELQRATGSPLATTQARYLTVTR